MNTVIGKAHNRVDGLAKVTGAAKYAAEHFQQGMLYGVVVGAGVPSGLIRGIDASAAERAPGVVQVYTHKNRPKMGNPPNSIMLGRGVLGDSQLPLSSNKVTYEGQPIAFIVAESLEQAKYAATCIRPDYERTKHAVKIEASEEEPSKPFQANGEKLQTSHGSVDKGREEANVHLDETYETPPEHPNPMEPHAIIASWNGEELEAYDASQWVIGTRNVIAGTLDVADDKVRVVAPFVGGMFGSKAATGAHVMLSALATRELGRPVKTVLTREQVMTNVGARSRTIQRFQIDAAADGRILALEHDTTSHTSKTDDFPEPCGLTSRMLYNVPNYRTSHSLVSLNTVTPAWMRAPGEAPCTFALESALDELAYKLDMDPIQLRRINHAEINPHTGKPFSFKFLLEAYDRGAELFDWKSRNPKPGSMRDGRILIGQGMATATYPAMTMGATVRVRLSEVGGKLQAVVSTAGIDVGTGMYTMMAMTAADAFGIPVESVTPLLGDSSLPPCALAGGSNLTSSVAPAILQACETIRKELGEGNLLDAFRASGKSFIEAEGETKPIMHQDKNYAYQSFGAQFAEVRIDPVLRTIRMSRMVGVFNCGKIVNAKAARSQMLGGMTFGIGMALLEELVWDQTAGRAVNADLADYMVPVNADVPNIQVDFVGEPDINFNPLGVRGIGEIGNTGAAAAIANAVYHATGKRVRKLPILIESIL